MKEIKRYRCIKEMWFENCDEDGLPLGQYTSIPVGSIWQECPYMVAGGKNNIHLDREDLKGSSQWCEPLKEHMEEYFEEIEPIRI